MAEILLVKSPRLHGDQTHDIQRRSERFNFWEIKRLYYVCQIVNLSLPLHFLNYSADNIYLEFGKTLHYISLPFPIRLCALHSALSNIKNSTMLDIRYYQFPSIAFNIYFYEMLDNVSAGVV